jgi:hypothetical protein
MSFASSNTSIRPNIGCYADEDADEVRPSPSLRGALATRQSMFASNKFIPRMDCFVIPFLAMTGQQSTLHLTMPI